MEQRIDRLEDRVEKLEKDLKAQEIEFAETRVYVREGYKKMDSIQIALEAMKTATGSEWKQFFEKGFWLAAGSIVTFLVTKIHF